MPHYGDSSNSVGYLQEAIESVILQTDQNWILVIVDDCSPLHASRVFLRSVSDHPKIHVVFQAARRGPGPSRNAGIELAHKLGSRFVLFLDSDDLATSNRLVEVRRAFQDDRVDVIYSPFQPIDLASRELTTAELTPSIASILQYMTDQPPEGYNVWQKIATTTGYINLTSTTGVRIELATAVPFPEELVSEDFHTWIRYSASGGFFKFLPFVSCKYRLPSQTDGSACRRRYGSGYYREKARVDSHGFECAVQLARQAGSALGDSDWAELRSAFRSRLAVEIEHEGEGHLADALRALNPTEVAPDAFFSRIDLPTMHG